MRKQAFLFLLALGASSAWAQQATVSGPDNQLKVGEISVRFCLERRRFQPRHDLYGTKDPEH